MTKSQPFLPHPSGSSLPASCLGTLSVTASAVALAVGLMAINIAHAQVLPDRSLGPTASESPNAKKPVESLKPDVKKRAASSASNAAKDTSADSQISSSVATKARRWFDQPLGVRLNSLLDDASMRLGRLLTDPADPRPWWEKPLSERINSGLDASGGRVARLLGWSADDRSEWWRQPLADRLNARVDRIQGFVGRLEVRDILEVGRDLGLDGPTIWPDRVLPADRVLIAPDARLDLLQVWQAAKQNDPSLRASRAAFAAARERVPQARAQLLPQVQAGVSRVANEVTRDGLNSSLQPLTIFDRYPSSNDTLSLRQPLVRMQQVEGVKQAQSVQREAEAILLKDEQDFTSRVVGAYLECLLAADTVEFLQAQALFLESAVKAAQRAFDAGVGTVTDIDAARAKLDLNTAQLLQARQQVEYSRRLVEAVINRPFGSLVPLDSARLPRFTLTDVPLQEWLQRAQSNGPEVKRMLSQRESAEREIAKARAGHLPTLDAVAQLQRSRSENTISPQSRYVNSSVGLQLTVPLYNGGYVNSLTRQAAADRERIEEQLEALRLDVGVRVHREWRTVSEGVSRIKAMETALRSAEVALNSARRSFEAGVRTTVDILNADQQRLQAQRDLAEARYATLAALVRLQALAGESDEALIARINTLMSRP